MQVEILRLIDHRRYGIAAGYGLASIAVGYLAIWAATALVRRSRVLV
jgi:CrcB protein